MTKRKRQPQRKESKALRAGNNYQRVLAGLAIAVLLMLCPSAVTAQERMTELLAHCPQLSIRRMGPPVAAGGTVQCKDDDEGTG